MTQPPLGILLTNIGTPQSCTVTDVRSYLREFLSDPRVVKLPRLIWLPLLYGIILPFRAPASAKLYRNIWTATGSPLSIGMQQLTTQLTHHLAPRVTRPITVAYGMHYGQPSMASALDELRQQNIQELIVLPMFPQYSTASTATTFDQMHKLSHQYPDLLIHYITHYAEHPAYITAVSQTIKQYYRDSSYLLFSFHGIPQSFVDQGDPYAQLCHSSAALITAALTLPDHKWSVAFQSRFGYAKWLKPYTAEQLAALPQQGIVDLTVVCPGFAVDCLETLEEIALQGKEIFFHHGGKSFNYIPALNASTVHLEALATILAEKITP